MTEPVSGSSLLQARDSHSSQHNHHNHARSHHNHVRLHQRQDESQTAETVVQVVQTVSVVQLVDASGATVGTTTQTSEPSTTTQDAAEATYGVESVPDATSSAADNASDTTTSPVSSATPSSVDTATDTTASSIDSATETTISAVDPASVDATTSSSMTSSSFPTVESFAPITSALSDSTTTNFPTFAGVTNSTIAAVTTTSISSSASSSSSSSPSSSLNGTESIKTLVANLTTSTLPYSSGTILYNDTYTTTLGVSSTYSSTFASLTGTATSTGTEDGGSMTAYGYGGGATSGGSGGSGGGTATGDASSASSTSTGEAGSGSSSSSTTAGTVAGSVLGAVAGVGLILIAALMLIRYKKRQRGLRLSDGNGLPGTRGLVLGGGGPGPSNDPRGVGDMSQQRSVPFAVPAALANLTGYKRSSQRTITSSEGTERGFQKVSGRKLPSVLQHGGDGYTDPTNPRDTMMSDQSSYRDSIGFFGGSNQLRLAVGSPMRPESGIPVFHPGPAKVPVTQSGYFSSNLEPPPSRDALGRSHPSQDGSNHSRGSGSRFTEEI